MIDCPDIEAIWLGNLTVTLHTSPVVAALILRGQLAYGAGHVLS
jgi:hypothetical protein